MNSMRSDAEFNWNLTLITLPIGPEHAMAVESLAAHHQDPFDRILVAQALVEPMRLMTHDPMVALYIDTIIKV